MKATVDAREFAAAVWKLKPAKKNTLPVLGHFRMEATPGELVVTSTDLDTWAEIRLIAEDTEPGVALPQGHAVYEIARASKGEARITVESAGPESTRLITGAADHSVPSFPADQFPADPKGRAAGTSEHASELVRWWADHVARFCSTDDRRPILNGVEFVRKANKLTVSATSGHVLVTSSSHSEGDDLKMIVRAAALRKAGRLFAKVGGPIGLNQLGAYAQFMRENIRITTRYVDGPYPNWRGVLPKGKSLVVCEFERETLIEAIQPIHATVKDTPTKLSKWTITPDGIRVVAGGAGSPEVTANFEALKVAGEMTIGLNVGYVIQALKAFETEKVTLGLYSPERAIVFKARGAPKVLVMPLRLLDD